MLSELARCPPQEPNPAAGLSGLDPVPPAFYADLRPWTDKPQNDDIDRNWRNRVSAISSNTDIQRGLKAHQTDLIQMNMTGGDGFVVAAPGGH